jgi:hypothetical protein
LSRRKGKGKEKETRMIATKQLGSGDDRELGVRSTKNWKGYGKAGSERAVILGQIG